MREKNAIVKPPAGKSSLRAPANAPSQQGENAADMMEMSNDLLIVQC
ncbi:MAG: hypothetical protein AAGJ87_00360 [Pseudomonadota bacterium]